MPEVAKAAAHVDVYQRSAPYVLPKSDRAYGSAAQALFTSLPAIRKADRLRTFVYGELLTSGFVLSPKLLAAPMRMWRHQLTTQVSDPVLREKCVPDYVMGCKRASRTSVWQSGCHSWYTTVSGRNTNNWPDHTFLYRHRVRRFDLADYRVMPSGLA